MLYKTTNVPKRDRYKLGIGDNCVRTLTKVSKNSGGQGSWDEYEARDCYFSPFLKFTECFPEVYYI